MRNLGDIICDNTGITQVSSNVFVQGSPSVNCGEHNKLDLSLYLPTPSLMMAGGLLPNGFSSVPTGDVELTGTDCDTPPDLPVTVISGAGANLGEWYTSDHL